ncbi:MAG: threonine synthase [Myxococcota bacterium]
MLYRSTRGQAESITLSRAMVQGLAPDGGLYVPEALPRADLDELGKMTSLAEVATSLLAPFFVGDPLAPHLASICAEALDFPTPLRFFGHASLADTAVLELFHGPSAAFKDVGARFLAACLARLRTGQHQTVLVATSGDTGGAVAAAFFERPGFEVVILFPRDGVTGRQRQQLTAWGGNVHAFAVAGTFDDCQRLAKAAFADVAARERYGLTSANSINIGRLLPQVTYYAQAALAYQRQRGVEPGFIIPSGNLGNAVAAIWARALGLPVGPIMLATNANRTLSDFFATHTYRPRPSVTTLANAMDVGDPSNAERLFHLYPQTQALLPAARLDAISVSDDVIRATIVDGVRTLDEIFCPHTATAVHVRRQLGDGPWIVVATAHPAKFETLIEPLVGQTIALPAALARLLQRPAQVAEIAPELRALWAAL